MHKIRIEFLSYPQKLSLSSSIFFKRIFLNTLIPPMKHPYVLRLAGTNYDFFTVNYDFFTVL